MITVEAVTRRPVNDRMISAEGVITAGIVDMDLGTIVSTTEAPKDEHLLVGRGLMTVC